MASRRSVLAAATASFSLSSARAGSPVATSRDGALGSAAAELLRRSEAGHAALMDGDIAGYRAQITLADDFSLFSPFGGKPRTGGMSADQVEAMADFFKSGSMRQDLVHAMVSDDMVVLAVIEWNQGQVGGLPEQAWPLRVTLVYRRQGGDWRLVHRHADPLVHGLALPDAAAVARGDFSAVVSGRK